MERRGGWDGGGSPYVCTPCQPMQATLEQRIANRPEKLLPSPSTSVSFVFVWNSHRQSETSQSSIWRLIANFAPATWLNCDLTTFAQERMCDAEQRLCKRRQDDQSNSRSRSSPGVQLKPGYQRSGRPARVISFPAAYITVLTYQPANMLGWCIAGLKASAHSFGLVWHALDAAYEGSLNIYRKTGNLRAVQLLLGHTKLESTVRYLGIEVDDALNIAEQLKFIIDHRHHAGGRLRAKRVRSIQDRFCRHQLQTTAS